MLSVVISFFNFLILKIAMDKKTLCVAVLIKFINLNLLKNVTDSVAQSVSILVDDQKVFYSFSRIKK